MEALRRILVVDDDPSVRKLVADVLAMEGYAVTTAVDGPSALRSLELDSFDCIVLDVMMPGMDGHEVLASLRASKRSPTPVVMLTAHGDDSNAWKAWSGGVDYFLAKPFDAEELLRWLGYLFSERRVG